MTVCGIIGKPGNGKNCLATDIALKHVSYELKKPLSQRRKVFANFPIYDRRYSLSEIRGGRANLHPDVHRWDEWSEIARAESAVVFMDEAYRIFNSREWQKTSSDDLSKWTQHRKNGLTLYWIAQGDNQIDKVIRDNVTAKIWRIVRVLGPAWDEGLTQLEKHLGVLALATEWDADDFGKETKARALRRRLVNIEKYFGHFDTEWSVGDKLGAGKGSGAGIASASADRHGNRPLTALEAYQRWRTVDPFSGRILVRRPCDEFLEEAFATRSRSGAGAPGDDPEAAEPAHPRGSLNWPDGPGPHMGGDYDLTRLVGEVRELVGRVLPGKVA